jgi:hypothetical protein
MAQTKTSASRRRGASSSRTRSSSKSSPSRSNANRTRSANRARSSRTGASGAESIKETVKAGTQDSGKRIATLAEKAKTPLLMGGAALAGVAGATALTAHSRRRRKVLGVPLPKRNGLKVDTQKMTEAIADVAKRADRIGQRVSRVAGGVQATAETANATAKKS